MIIKSRIFIFFLTGLVFSSLLIFVNIYIFLNKNEGYVYYLSNYNSVYYPLDFPVISKLSNVQEDSVEVILSNSAMEQSWDISMNDSIRYKIFAKNPVLYLPITGENYISDFFICNEGNALCFSIRAQRQNLGDIHVIKSSIPYTEVPRYNFSEFCDVGWISQPEKDKILNVLKNELKIDTCSNTLSKIEVITAHINNISRRASNLELKFSWDKYTACEIYEKAVSGETSMTCNEYSEVYYLFSNLAGIKSRRVGVVGFANSDEIVKFSGHHFNESYILEQNKWAFVDVTSQKAYVLNGENMVLNTFELFMANLSDNYLDLTTTLLIKDSVKYVPYSQTRENESYYFNSDCVIQYKYGGDRFRLLNQIERYSIHPEPVLSLNYSNDRLFFKTFCLVLMLIASTVTILIFFKYISLKVKKKRKSRN